MKVTIVGTGLIGGAVAKAARAHRAASELIGVEPNAEHAALALKEGVVDRIEPAVPADADLIVLACPSDLVAGWVQSLASHSGVICDVGSVKAPIVDALQRDGGLPPRFVPSHPIAGSERSGPAHAPADLFDQRLVVLTPEPQTDAAALAAVTEFWQALGAETSVLSSAEHDRILALTSHLPHYLAYAFMLQVDEPALALSGGGFSDFTRIAAANPDMWWRIFTMNRAALDAALDEFEANLAELRAALAADDEATGLALLRQAARRRQQLTPPET